MTPKADLAGAPVAHAWESPVKLAGLSLVCVIVLNVIFR